MDKGKIKDFEITSEDQNFYQASQQQLKIRYEFLQKRLLIQSLSVMGGKIILRQVYIIKKGCLHHLLEHLKNLFFLVNTNVIYLHLILSIVRIYRTPETSSHSYI